MLRTLEGKYPTVHHTAFVSEFAYLIGDVQIGRYSSVWPGAVIRADMGKITIGDETCIQENSVLHGDADVVIGNRVIIGPKTLCHAWKVEDGTNINSGAIVNDGVKIGEGSFIESGTMILDNMVIPAQSLVSGVPGRVRGKVESYHLNLSKLACDQCVREAQRYKNAGMV